MRRKSIDIQLKGEPILIYEYLEERALFFVGLAILIVIIISTTTIEKSLKSIEKQNAIVIELLKDIRDKQ